ncbi:MAG: thioredoxin family protein [Magnetococcales bacterium]|nr:thioredoxin family protein [Magnetococcales bacterium]
MSSKKPVRASSEEKLFSLIDRISGHSYVFLVFSAPWCGACTKQYGVLKSWVKKNKDDAQAVIADIERHPSLTNTFGLRSIPTLVVIRGNRKLIKVNGLQSKRELGKLLKKAQDAYVQAPTPDQFLG